MEDLDPYRGMPALPQSEGLVIPLLEVDEDDEESSGMDGFPNHRVDRAIGRVEGGRGVVGETAPGRRLGENRSAQVRFQRT